MAALPYVVSVAVWYTIGIAATFLAVHWLAVAVEAGLSRAPRRYGYLWWSLRLVPLLVILPATGRTLARGQVNTIVVALIAGWAASLVTGRRVRAGVMLAFAICIKVIPAFLVLHPLWRRDRRCLAGLAGGLGFALVVLPVLLLTAACGFRPLYGGGDATSPGVVQDLASVAISEPTTRLSQLIRNDLLSAIRPAGTAERRYLERFHALLRD